MDVAWILLIIGLFALVLWIYAIIDIVRGSLAGNSRKILWLIVVIIFPIIGAILYLILAKR
jgi:hypothetical protein